MKLIIFGSTGTVGRHLVDQALSLGHEVTAFARNPEKLEIEHAERTPTLVRRRPRSGLPRRCHARSRCRSLRPRGGQKGISRADVAGFVLKQLEDDTYLRQNPGLSY